MTYVWLATALILFLYWLIFSIAFGWRSSVLIFWLAAALYSVLCAFFAKDFPLLLVPPALAAGLFALLLILSVRRPRGFGEEPQLLMVLGVRNDGTQPASLFDARVDTAHALAERFPHCPILLAGGRVFGETISEAEAMKQALLARGIDPHRLILESESLTTRENFILNRALLSGKRVAVITNRYHFFRASLLAAAQVKNTRFSFFGKNTGGFFLIHLYFRELLTLFADLFRGRFRYSGSEEV